MIISALYFWGVLGCIVTEAFTALAQCERETLALPATYRRPSYLAIRLIVALCAGVIPLVLDAQSIFAAFYLGVSAPLFLDRLAKAIEAEAKG